MSVSSEALAVCPDVFGVPVLQVFVSAITTVLIAVLFASCCRGTSFAAFVGSSIAFLYLALGQAYFSIHSSYMTWNHSPGFVVLYECEMNAEFNEFMFSKMYLLYVLQLKTKAMCRFQEHRDQLGCEIHGVFTLIFNLVMLLSFGSWFLRFFFISIVSPLAFSWPYVYLTYPIICVMIPAARYVQTSNFLDYARVLDDDNFDQDAMIDALNGFDAGSVALRILAIAYNIGVAYLAIVSFSYRFSTNGVSYTQAFYDFGEVRPSIGFYYEHRFGFYSSLLFG